MPCRAHQLLYNIINYFQEDESIILAAILVYKYFNTLEIFYSSRNCIYDNSFVFDELLGLIKVIL